MRAHRIRSLSIKRLLTLRLFKFSCAQLLFLSGVMLIIGPTKTYRFFFQKRKAKGTACFLGGIALVLYGWAMIGIIVEGWGFLNLFGDFFPTALCVALASTHTHSSLHAHTARSFAHFRSAFRTTRADVRLSSRALAFAEASCATCRSSGMCSRSSRCAESRIA